LSKYTIVTENSGTVLPGYTPSVGFLGSSRRWEFIFGSRMMFVLKLQKWLVNKLYQDFNQNFTQVKNKIFKATANVDLFP
jgi:hypothetical protein